MTMQISVNPARLTQEQRESVSSFILSYPYKSRDETHLSDQSAVVNNLDPEIAQLIKEDAEFEALVAFGERPVPLPQGATAAPSIAVADQSSIAHSGTMAITFTVDKNVPVPPAPNYVPTVVIVAPQTGNRVGDVDLDKTGLPWDFRIHAESKSKIADGTWRKKRNIDVETVTTVEAELRKIMVAPVASIPAPPVAPPVAPIPAPPVAPPVAPIPAPPVAPPVAPIPAPPVAPHDARAKFVALVGRSSAALNAGKVTHAEILQCCTDAGVPALPLLANRLDLVDRVAANIDSMIRGR